MDLPVMSELLFEVTKETPEGYAAECLTENLSTTATNWGELRDSVKQVVKEYFHDGPKPQSIRLHLIREEVISLL